MKKELDSLNLYAPVLCLVSVNDGFNAVSCTELEFFRYLHLSAITHDFKVHCQKI